MQKTLLLVAGALCAGLPAQTPSCNGPAPASTFTTLWAGGVYLGTTSATAGFNAMFDLTTNGPIDITQIDMNFYNDGSVATLPNLVGQTTTVDLYTCPTTSVGLETNMAAWTLQGTANVTIAAHDLPGSACVFSTPITLPAGSYGVVLNVLPVTTGSVTGPLNPLYTNPASSPGTATVYTDQYMTLTARGFQGTAWTGVPALRVINTTIHYQPPATSAYSIQYGEGCYNYPQSYYEYQVGPGSGSFNTWDFSNSAISMINQGDDYLVFPSSATVTTPTSTPLTTAGATYDDDITAPIPLPWTFPYPGGTTGQIIVSTNGHIFLGSSPATFGPYNFAQFFSDVPRLACAWMDLDLTNQGTMHYDVDPGNQFVQVTWLNCPEWDPNASIPGLGSNTFQITLWQNGDVDYAYGTVTVYNCPLVVGYGRGDGTADPGSVDLSAALPLTSGDGSEPSQLSLSGRPIIGTTTDFVCSNITAGTSFGIMIFSFGSTNPTELSAFGMPGCYQHVTIPGFNLFAPVVSGQITAALALPNQASYNGVNIFGQVGLLTAGQNPTGVTFSNGVCVHIGLN
ncbi:MAG: hypothetical protein KDE27_04170 [Planctomycetes bacterium]|nr:hypothetical protein [Planctomycetota bacterium]